MEPKKMEFKVMFRDGTTIMRHHAKAITHEAFITDCIAVCKSDHEKLWAAQEKLEKKDYVILTDGDTDVLMVIDC